MQPLIRAHFLRVSTALTASTENKCLPSYRSQHSSSPPARALTCLSPVTFFMVLLRFFLVKLDFQVGAGSRVSELPEVGLQVSRLFSSRYFFFCPSALHPPPGAGKKNNRFYPPSALSQALFFSVHADRDNLSTNIRAL